MHTYGIFPLSAEAEVVPGTYVPPVIQRITVSIVIIISSIIIRCGVFRGVGCGGVGTYVRMWGISAKREADHAIRESRRTADF